MIDIVLAGDNAIVVGALAAGLPADQRKKVILIGISAALVLRIVFALIVTWLMGIVGLIFAGGLLLLWVSWKFWREIRSGGHAADRGEHRRTIGHPRPPRASSARPGRWRSPTCR